jgi:DNA invertase Pin-like site-specific DNA recombinase
MKTPSHVPLPTAYSYIRFSSPEQAKGDSLRRQKEGALQWCERYGIRLDTSLTLHDKGVSAFKGLHRENPDKHALALFLKLVERERVHPGDYLLIENLDRLSREHEVAACHLLTGILSAGIRVVQLSPYEMLLTEKSNGWELMRAIMELSRGHSESVIKSERIGKAWRKRLAAAREGKLVLTKAVPAWIEVREGRLRLIPERAAAIKRIYQLSTLGYGIVTITRKLTEEGVPPFGEREWYREVDEDGNVKEGWRAVAGKRYGAGWWSRSYVCQILHDRRVLGEFQPMKGDKTPDGVLMLNYFPAIITQKEFDLARAGLSRRKQGGGRTTKYIDLFAGLVKNARDGGTYHSTTRSDRRMKYRVLVNTAGTEGRTQCWAFPYSTFERAVLSMLREVDPKEVIGEDKSAEAEDALRNERDRVEARIAEYEAELDNGELAVLARKLRELKDRRVELDRLIAEARRKAAKPLSDAWDETHSTLKALEKAADTDDFRVRLRTALRRIVDSIWVVFSGRVRDRFAHVQICFAGCERTRDYFIVHRPPQCGRRQFYRPGKWVAISVGLETAKHRGKVPDLREYRSDPAVRKFFDERLEKHRAALQEVFEGLQKQWDIYAKARDLPPDFPPLEMHEDWGQFAQCGYLEPLCRRG